MNAIHELSSPAFSSGMIELFAVSKAPDDNVFDDRGIDEATSFRFVRYVVPGA